MRTFKYSLVTLTVSILVMVAADVAQATVLRAFVSSTGNDANAATNCAQTAPCKTFAGAFPTVTAGGELIALDTSGYGPLSNINKAITIAAVPGATAFVVAATGTAGFTINGAASDTITLRRINFNGSNALNTTGVLHNSGRLIVDECNFTQLTIGLSVVNSKVDVYSSNFDSNTTGIQTNGQGADDQMCPPCGGTTQVRLERGNIRNNGNALVALNPDFRPMSTDNRKPFLLHSDSSPTTNFAGNTTMQSGSGNGCTMGCFQVTINYGSTANPH